jgi:formamidopyrimidine-DNA glycosylase
MFVPELPDVEVFKRYLDATSLHKSIREVKVEDHRVLRDVSVQKLKERLRGKKIHRTRRHGKYLLANLDEREWLVLHFGMSGRLKYFRVDDSRPRHSRVLLTFSNGFHLAYVSKRMLGEVGIFKGHLDDFIEEKELGVDAGEIGWQVFKEHFKSRRGTIKSALMNQKIMAGLGNIYTDEVLFQARVHPKTSVSDLDAKRLKSLFKKMNSVLKTAIDCQADPEKIPDSYLLLHRNKEGRCPRSHGVLSRIKINARTTYFCPECQGQP